jgi:hypothetical protein
MSDTQGVGQPARPRGKPLSEAELDALAEITDEDLKAAEDLWRRSVPAGMKNLLDAKPDPAAGPVQDQQSPPIKEN